MRPRNLPLYEICQAIVDHLHLLFSYLVLRRGSARLTTMRLRYNVRLVGAHTQRSGVLATKLYAGVVNHRTKRGQLFAKRMSISGH